MSLQAPAVTFCGFRRNEKVHLFRNIEEGWEKKKGILIPRIAMQCHVYKSTCYQVCKRQSSAVNIRYPIQVHQPAEPGAVGCLPWAFKDSAEEAGSVQLLSPKAHVQRGDFQRTGPNPATLHVSHPSQWLQPDTSWDSLQSNPVLVPGSIHCPAHSSSHHFPGPCCWAAANKGAISTPPARAPQQLKNAGCCAGWKAWESAALLFHVNIPPPLPFPRSQAENPFLFLSVQTRTMNSSSPQECDKVPTKPTRKVMYGL